MQRPYLSIKEEGPHPPKNPLLKTTPMSSLNEYILTLITLLANSNEHILHLMTRLPSSNEHILFLMTPIPKSNELRCRIIAPHPSLNEHPSFLAAPYSLRFTPFRRQKHIFLFNLTYTNDERT